MKQKQLEEMISDETGICLGDVSKVIESFKKITLESVKKDDPVYLVGFGQFRLFIRHARSCGHPRVSGQTFQVPETKVMKFVTGKKTKDYLKV